MGQGQSHSGLQTCLSAVCGNRTDCVAYPNSTLLYQSSWVKPYNLYDPVVPAAVIRPNNAEDVSGIVKCAVENKFHVQAKSGGHSYANFGLGGQDGSIAVDLTNLQDFSIDNSTWQASFGSGFKLGDIDTKLHDNGGRATAHGICPGVGIGGHATIGGIGPMSRMWGTLLDQVLEVEVVTSNGTILRANENQNSDLFWALRGAGASFGIITEFVIKTHPEPGSVVQYSYSFSFGSQAEMIPVFSTWQDLVYDPKMDDRFSSLFIAEPLGALITGTFYGTEAEYNASGIPDKLPTGGIVSGNITTWLGNLAHMAQTEALYLSNTPTQFYSKSLAFTEQDRLDNNSISDVFDYMGATDAGTITWFVIWDTEGGQISRIAADSTAYPHRDKILMYQSYAIGIPALDNATISFVEGLDVKIRAGTPNANSTYAGYVDPKLSHDVAVNMYWPGEMAKLQTIKTKWDPYDLFHNPQSITPTTNSTTS